MHSFLLTMLLYHCGGAIVAVILVRIVLMAVVDVPVSLIALIVFLQYCSHRYWMGSNDY